MKYGVVFWEIRSRVDGSAETKLPKAEPRISVEVASISPHLSVNQQDSQLAFTYTEKYHHFFALEVLCRTTCYDANVVNGTFRPAGDYAKAAAVNE